uniref:Uncharacterized protein n=1 Tax=Arundo donax TaxID=35708 RepID=A0A0A8ZCE7_ARUDO
MLQHPDHGEAKTAQAISSNLVTAKVDPTKLKSISVPSIHPSTSLIIIIRPNGKSSN